MHASILLQLPNAAMHSNDYNDMKSRMGEMLIKVLCDLQEAAFELERLNYASYQPVNKSIRPRFCKKCQVRVPLHVPVTFCYAVTPCYVVGFGPLQVKKASFPSRGICQGHDSCVQQTAISS